ncbi:MAG: prepilin-type N-terminal cleavage/methylation domain-containing protein [Armatimonadetes bacterium]|nr:prepilin-type N-terminal cleavage/methylation domain-containing protein [Armatimonadota bacterium]
MMSRMVDRKSKGFTLIEMLIVIVVIAILALIVIPRLLGAGRKAKEATLRGDLHQIRNAIQQFEADCGDYPLTLDQLMNTPSGDGGTGIALDAAGWQGPYLRTPDDNLPKDPFTDSSTSWSYTPATGHVASGSTLTAINGEAYSSW